MYIIPHFQESEPSEVRRWMDQYPFVTLCGSDAAGKLVVTHIPVIVKERDGTLLVQGHVMRKQDHTRAFEQNPEVVAIFHGPQGYVSASWYTTPLVASTWNYLVVHARGKLIFKDTPFLMGLLAELTARFEGDPLSPSLVENMKGEYLEQQARAIVGFEIEVHTIEHVCKMSQNRDQPSYDTIIRRLEERGGASQEVARFMAARKAQVFGG